MTVAEEAAPAADVKDVYLRGPAFRAAGLTYRRLDTWTTCGYLRTVGKKNPGSGQARLYPAVELAVARAMMRLHDRCGLDLPTAASIAGRIRFHPQPIPTGTIFVGTDCPGVSLLITGALWTE